jgi:hypothetical protein
MVNHHWIRPDLNSDELAWSHPRKPASRALPFGYGFPFIQQRKVLTGNQVVTV